MCDLEKCLIYDARGTEREGTKLEPLWFGGRRVVVACVCGAPSREMGELEQAENFTREG